MQDGAQSGNSEKPRLQFAARPSKKVAESPPDLECSPELLSGTEERIQNAAAQSVVWAADPALRPWHPERLPAAPVLHPDRPRSPHGVRVSAHPADTAAPIWHWSGSQASATAGRPVPDRAAAAAPQPPLCRCYPFFLDCPDGAIIGSDYGHYTGPVSAGPDGPAGTIWHGPGSDSNEALNYAGAVSAGTNEPKEPIWCSPDSDSDRALDYVGLASALNDGPAVQVWRVADSKSDEARDYTASPVPAGDYGDVGPLQRVPRSGLRGAACSDWNHWTMAQSGQW